MLKEGVVIRVTRSSCLVDAAELEAPMMCALRKKLTQQKKRQKTLKHPVAVGDKVLFSISEESQENQGVIEKILTRKNKFSRPSVRDSHQEQVVVANLDQVVIVVAITEGQIPYGTIDRFLCSGENAEIESIICLNKIDLADPEYIQTQIQHYSDIGYKILLTSALTKFGIENLENSLKGKTSAFCGPSGAGKSSLLTTIQPSLKLRTQEVNPKTKSGRHTTSAVSLIRLDMGGYVVDTPGIREIGLWKLTSQELSDLFIEFQNLDTQCRFRSCLHQNEPDCAVKEALTLKQIHRERYASYRRILESLIEEEKESLN